MGLRKNQQTAVSVLHDMEILQLEPLSKEVSAVVKNERDNELTRQVSDELLRVKALMTVLPGIPVIATKRFDSIDDHCKLLVVLMLMNRLQISRKKRNHC